jgi:hypothetical protein
MEILLEKLQSIRTVLCCSCCNGVTASSLSSSSAAAGGGAGTKDSMGPGRPDELLVSRCCGSIICR